MSDDERIELLAHIASRLLAAEIAHYGWDAPTEKYSDCVGVVSHAENLLEEIENRVRPEKTPRTPR